MDGDGAVWAFPGPLSGTVDVSAAATRLDGTDQEALGGAIAAGDFDGDGAQDLAINALYAQLHDSQGAIYVVANADIVAGSAADRATAVLYPSPDDERSLAGHALATLGDLGGDGADELVVTGPATDGSNPKVWIEHHVMEGGLLGGTTTLVAQDSHTECCTAVDAGRDVDGDGVPDLLLGTPFTWDSEGGSNRGTAFLVPGQAGAGW